MSDEPTSGSDNAEQAGAPVEPQSVEELPQWAQQQLTKARNEAAKYRTERNESKEAYSELENRLNETNQLQEQHEALLGQNAQIEAERDRLKAAVTAGLPSDRAEDLAQRLQGESFDELVEDAKRLADMVGAHAQPAAAQVRTVDPSQGRGNDTPLNGNPIQQAVEKKLGISHA